VKTIYTAEEAERRMLEEAMLLARFEDVQDIVST